MNTDRLPLTDDSDNPEMETAEIFRRLSRDLKKSSQNLSRRDARYLVDQFYVIQEQRIRAAHQTRGNQEEGEPHELIDWVFESMRICEDGIKAALGEFAKTYRVGRWMQSQYGIGPVISAALLAHFDIRKAPAAPHFWSFAGLSPNKVWNKGEKRPWNARLKTICVFKMGESFVKFHNRDKCFYGKLWAQKKQELIAQNESGTFAEVAEKEIEKWSGNKKMQSTQRMEHWKTGKLAPAHIHDRARRWTVCMFISHLHHVMYSDFHGKLPPIPYIFAHPVAGMEHVHPIKPHLWPESEGGDDAEIVIEGRKLSDMKD